MSDSVQNVKVTEEALRKLVSERIERVTDMAIDLIVRKNHDYGDAWQKNGIFTPLMRIKEKLLRVETLSDGRQALVADESIDQDMEDTFNYSLLEMLKLESLPQLEEEPRPKVDPEKMIQMICRVVDDFNAVADLRPEAAKKAFNYSKMGLDMAKGSDFAVLSVPVEDNGTIEVDTNTYMTQEAFLKHMRQEGYRCQRITLIHGSK